MQRWMCSHLCLGSLEKAQPLSAFIFEKWGWYCFRNERTRKASAFVFLIRTSNFIAWPIGLDLSCSISIKNVWDHHLGNAANQSGSEIFVLVWHWHYSYSLRWIPIGVHCCLLPSGVKAKLSALLVFPLWYKINLCFWKDLKKNSVKTQ